MRYRSNTSHAMFTALFVAAVVPLGMASCAQGSVLDTDSDESVLNATDPDAMPPASVERTRKAISVQGKLSDASRAELLMQRHTERLQRSPHNAVSGRIYRVGEVPIQGVTVRVGRLETKTDAEGGYAFDKVPLGHHVVTFEHPAYVFTQRHVVVQQGDAVRFDGHLLPRSEPQSFDADRGARIVQGPLALDFEPTDLSFEDGEPVHGKVDVVVTVADPRRQGHLEAAPAELEGITAGGEQVGLVSYGMLEVEITQAGRKVNVKHGETVTAAMNLGNDFQVGEGDEIPMWHHDTKIGTWVQERGKNAKLEPRDGGWIATVDLPHFSAWNYDSAVDATCAQIPFNGTPVITNFRIVSTDAAGNMDPASPGMLTRWWFSSTCGRSGQRSTCFTNVPSGPNYGVGVYFKFQAQNPATGSWSDVAVTLNAQSKTVLRGTDINTWLASQGKSSGSWCGTPRPANAPPAYFNGEFQLGTLPLSIPANRVLFGAGVLADTTGLMASSDPGFATMRTNSLDASYASNYDRDGANDGTDGCIANSSPQTDTNGNNIGDGCEDWCYVPASDPYASWYDYDGDTVDDMCDILPLSANPSQYLAQ